MSAEVNKLPDEPIIIARLYDHVTVEDLLMVFEQTDQLFGPEERIYRITDVHEATSSFADILKIIGIASKQAPGSSTDPRIKAAFVGTNKWAQLARQALNRDNFGGVDLPIFIEFEDALDYMRRRIALDSNDEEEQAASA